MAPLSVVMGGISVVLGLLYLGYLWALPRPIPGIPYNKEATNSIFGDIKSMVKFVGEHDQIWEWMRLNQDKLQSPIIQLFARPFGRPWVIIFDFRESQDILLRRHREFDRSPFIDEVFGGVAPEHHFPMPTNNTWKHHRKLVQDLMSPAFLHKVAAPSIYNGFLDLLRLWELKSKISEGRPFSVDKDIFRAALDVLWSSMFNLDPSGSSTRAQIEKCSTNNIPKPSSVDEAIQFPLAPNPPAIQAILELSHSIEVSMKSPIPRLAYRIQRLKSSLRNANKIKDEFIKQQVDKTVKRFGMSAEKEREVRCAMDGVLTKEIILAEKEGREPIFHSQAIYDEIFGFIIGAHDTTSTTITWALKLLTTHQDVQAKLRSSFRSSLNEAVFEKRLPSIQEITNLNLPYLDAVVEEILRCGMTAPGTGRVALADVEILGHRIPKGTEVFLMNNGASIKSPGFEIKDSLRSPSYHASKDRIGNWDPKGMAEFNPDRWIVVKDGKEVFDPHAGPTFPFGLGVRGCYGRKLAYMQLKIILLLIIWNFELKECPEALSSFDAIDGLTHAPKQCYVRLTKLE